MKRTAALSRLPLLMGALTLAATCARADDTGTSKSGGAFILAEIVVPTQKDSGDRAAKSAAEVRGKAKAYQGSGSGAPTIIVIPEEEEEGLLGPRRQPESGASVNRAKARQYQQGQGSQLPIPMTKDAGNTITTSSDHANDNRARARSYVSTDNKLVIERVGSDGIPIVSCGRLVANEAGRIGDDVQPGGIFFIMRDNKPFKVRCDQ
jgi:hypothetical protein